MDELPRAGNASRCRSHGGAMVDGEANMVAN